MGWEIVSGEKRGQSGPLDGEVLGLNCKVFHRSGQNLLLAQFKEANVELDI